MYSSSFFSFEKPISKPPIIIVIVKISSTTPFLIILKKLDFRLIDVYNIETTLITNISSVLISKIEIIIVSIIAGTNKIQPMVLNLFGNKKSVFIIKVILNSFQK